MTPLLWAGLAVAVPLAAWWLWQRPMPHDPMPFDCERCGFTAEDERHVTDALDVVAEPDHRRAEHMNRTLRRVEGGDET